MATNDEQKSLQPNQSDELSGQRPARLGRRRFLTTLTGGLFAVAAKAFVPESAFAAPPTPAYCEGAPGCYNCSGQTCTDCSQRSYNCQLVQGRTCWTATAPAGNGCQHVYSCCDWINPATNDVCICRGYSGIWC